MREGRKGEEEGKGRRKERRGGRKGEEEGKGRRKERREEWRGGDARDLESGLYLFYLHGDDQGVTKKCRLSWLTNNSTIVLYLSPNVGGVGDLQGLGQ